MKDKFYLKLLFLILLIFFLPFLINPSLLANQDNDLGRNYIPIFAFIRKSLLTYHQIPLWRPDQLMGESFISNPISSLFYPANLLFLIFPANLGSVIYYLIHFLIAAFSTYYLAKSFSFSQKAAFISAIFYGFSTKMLIHLSAGHITMIAAFALFPLLFLSVRKMLVKFDIAWIFTGAAALAFTYFAYPTIFYYDSIFISFYFAYRFFKDKNYSANFLKFSASWALLFIFAILLMSIELFPHLEFAPLSTRGKLTLQDVALPLWNKKKFLEDLFIPYLSSNINTEEFLYLGLSPMFLALIGFFSLSKLKKIILIIFGLFTLLFVLGLSTPFFEYLYNYAPLLKYSRITTRPWFIVALVVALLSGLAIDRIKLKKLFIIICTLFLLENSIIFITFFKKTPALNFQNEDLYRHIKNDTDLFRVYCTTYCFNPQLLSKYEIEILNGENPIQHDAFIKFLARAGNYTYDNFAVIFPPYQAWQQNPHPVPDAQLLGNANVKYIASTYELKDKNLIPDGYYQDIYLYLNNLFVPRFSTVQTDSPIQVASYSSNAVNLKFEKQNIPRSIIISQNSFPGWNAFVVNRQFEITAEPPFSKVTVPSDTIDLWLKYQPASFVFGRTLTLAALVFMLLVILKTKRKNEKNRNL